MSWIYSKYINTDIIYKKIHNQYKAVHILKLFNKQCDNYKLNKHPSGKLLQNIHCSRKSGHYGMCSMIDQIMIDLSATPTIDIKL